MKKALGTLLALAILLVPINAIAAVKAGASCSKLGVTSTYAGKKYTCIKSGKKLVWDKGVTVVVSKASTPIGPTSFNDLESTYSGVPQAAWRKSRDVLNASKAKNVQPTILIGPNSRPVYEIPQVAISQVSRLFPNFQESKEFVLIYFNYQDSSWAQAQFDKYIGTNGGYDTSGEVKKLCPGEKGCQSAAAVRNQVTGISVVLITAGPTSSADKHFQTGAIEAHEYFHTIQDTQLVGTPVNNGMLPRWLIEGSASFVEMASINYDSFDKYKIAKASLLTELLYRKEFNEKKLIQFLDAPSLGKDWSSWDSYSTQRVYDIGMMVTEIMVSLKGPESILEQNKYVASGLSYQKAFEKVFGISWADGVKVIAKVLAKQIG
jgi:hypothetical protein